MLHLYNIIFYTGRLDAEFRTIWILESNIIKDTKSKTVKSRHFLSKAEIFPKKPRKNNEALKALFYMNEQ